MDGRANGAARPAATTRRGLLKAIGAGVSVTALGTAVSTAQQSDYWTVVALPDTQMYAKNQTAYATDQTRWIADNVDAENIAFVSHEGDVVDHGDDDAEWQYMDEAMATLDGTVPYATVTGNHDYATLWDRQSSVAKYKEYFGPSRYDGRDWFGGAGPSNGDENRDNLSTYQLFSAGGYDFLHLALEWEPPGAVDDPATPLGWAQNVLDQYPDRAAILTTHSYLRDSPKRRAQDLQEANDIGNTGQTIWEDLVSPNDQLFMVLCGHWHEDDGETYQVSTNDAGSPVYELLANYQFRPNGGNGLMRRIEFRPGGGSDAPDRIQVRTYSPSTGEEQTDSDSQFGFDLDFDSRFGSSSSETPERTETPETPAGPSATFQQGTDGYSGTTDTMLRAADPETSYGTAESLSIDGSDPEGSGRSTQVLLRFDGIIGTDAGQVPPGSDVEQATVTLQTSDEGDGAAIHRLRTDWSADSTWASLGGGVQTDGSGAVSDAVAETGAVGTGETSVAVTASVQAWVDGARNDGWVFRPLGNNGWDIQSSSSATPPVLTVSYTPSDTTAGDADGDGDVDTDDVTRIQRSVAGEDVDIDRDAADVDGDGDIDIGDAVSTRNLSGGDQ
ncbi:DNRLRE domain-containing protein [Haloarcula sp. S1AR25-5A]|uniref:DNRLRE domain-containing protein n=1 Tax=Haloarcula terrestris TaxID=2950533 RepID=A0AAE4JHB1_9EURY|nr:DNRLRE domain-containing protein [Haloarcula terrestris]MDS0219966.1 DNRLRE domain-containing protein [Haloarcula terrestris]